jgi:hypothetical protein
MVKSCLRSRTGWKPEVYLIVIIFMIPPEQIMKRNILVGDPNPSSTAASGVNVTPNL